MKIIFLLLSVLMSVSLLAMPAHRPIGKSYQEMANQFLSMDMMTSGATANGSAVPFDQLDLNQIPNWGSYEIAMAAFQYVRDTSFIVDPDDNTKLRRSSWLYPQDGCFARAELAVFNLEYLGIPAPKKIFIFGDLDVKTVFSSRGEVSWWYHVAPIFRIGRRVFVLDPAIEMNHPIELVDWIKRQLEDDEWASTKFNICHKNAYVPSSDCNNGDLRTHRMAGVQQLRYLKRERRNLESLGFPLSYLFEKPPWYLGNLSL